MKDHERIVARAPHEHQDVPQSVEPEVVRQGIGPLAREDDRPDRVRQPAGDEPGEALRSDLPHDGPRRQKREVPHGEVGDRRKPDRGVEIPDLEGNARAGHRPDRSEEGPPPRVIEGQERHRRVGAGDEEVDRDVVEYPEGAQPGRGGGDAVIDRAGRVQQDQRPAVDAEGEALGRTVGSQQQPGRAGRSQHEPDEMGPGVEGLACPHAPNLASRQAGPPAFRRRPPKPILLRRSLSPESVRNRVHAVTTTVERRALRIALFSEVYWPMVSGVGVTLLRLTEALQARGHGVRVYSATYALPDGQPDRPEAHRSPSVPFFLYPDVQWAFPRLRDVVEDLARFRPDVVHVATEFSLGIAGLKAARQLGIPMIASAHTDYDDLRRPVRGRLGRAGGVALPALVLRAGAPGALPVAHLRGAPARRGVRHTGIWSSGVDPGCFHPRFRSEEYRARFGVGPDDLLVTYIGRLAREKNLELLLGAWEAAGAVRGALSSCSLGVGRWRRRFGGADCRGCTSPA